MTYLVRHTQIVRRDGDIDQDVVGEQWDEGFEREADVAVLHCGFRYHDYGPDECEDGYGAETNDDDDDSCEPVWVSEAAEGAG